MKQIFAAYILPLCIAVAAALYLINDQQINKSLFGTKEKNPKTALTFIDNFENHPEYEDWFLRSGENSETIFMLGSSELTLETEACPYNFITKHFTTKVNAVGHAGNQCFSIYSQLLANQERLTNAPVIIILSPIWFHSDNALGTTSKIFLEFNSEHFLDKINENNSLPEFKAYENQRLSELYKDLTMPNLPLRQLHFEHEAPKSFLHKVMYTPLILTDKFLIDQKLKILHPDRLSEDLIHKAIVTDSIRINWDSLFAFSKKEMLAKATNNPWGIDNDYYNEHIHGNVSKVKVGDEERNTELTDLKMLLKLLKTKRANARFIIIPMNPYYYTNLEELTPVINTIENEIKKNQYEYLNFWVTDTAKFEKGILKDVMHLSDYGWHIVNKFIVETYHLNK